MGDLIVLLVERRNNRVLGGFDFVVKAMQLAIEKYIDNNPQQSSRLPTRVVIFFDLTNQFNSVSREEFKNVIATSFPELLPLVTLLYNHPTPSTTNGVADHGSFSSWKKVQVKDACSHLSLPHSSLHAYSNPLIAYSPNAWRYWQRRPRRYFSLTQLCR